LRTRSTISRGAPFSTAHATHPILAAIGAVTLPNCPCPCLNSVGNYYAADLKYCIDHINGTVYAKTSASDGTGYFELDQLGPMTNQCRVSIDATGAKLLSASGLTCGVTSSAAVMGITNFTLTATVTVPVVAPPPDDCSNSTADPAFFSTCATDGGCFRLATPEHYKQAGNDFRCAHTQRLALLFAVWR
jgi:hypothetical protein